MSVFRGCGLGEDFRDLFRSAFLAEYQRSPHADRMQKRRQARLVAEAIFRVYG
jgi:hypothetical protein